MERAGMVDAPGWAALMHVRQERSIRRNAFARCPFSAAIEHAHRFLERIALRGSLRELVVASDVSAVVVEDFTDETRRHDALELRWQPCSKLFPAGDALLTVRPHAPQGTELQFSIAYVPPLGAFGRLFDQCVGRHIAWLTSGLLLRRLRIEIERAHLREACADRTKVGL